MNRPRRLIQSIKRATDVLNIFVHEKSALGITELSKRLELCKTEFSKPEFKPWDVKDVWEKVQENL
jgi:hypothetical protein